MSRQEPGCGERGGDPAGPARQPLRAEVIEKLRTEMRRYLGAVDAFDEGVAESLDLSRTDLRCLDILERHGTLTAGTLAELCGLTTGAVTNLLDRLEEAQMVRRRRDTEDRRRVLVELVPAADRRLWRLHEPMVEEMRVLVARYGVEELAIVRDFMAEARAIYERHAPALGQMVAGHRGTAAGGTADRPGPGRHGGPKAARTAARQAARTAARQAVSRSGTREEIKAAAKAAAVEAARAAARAAAASWERQTDR